MKYKREKESEEQWSSIEQILYERIAVINKDSELEINS